MIFSATYRNLSSLLKVKKNNFPNVSSVFQIAVVFALFAVFSVAYAGVIAGPALLTTHLGAPWVGTGLVAAPLASRAIVATPGAVIAGPIAPLAATHDHGW